MPSSLKRVRSAMAAHRQPTNSKLTAETILSGDELRYVTARKPRSKANKRNKIHATLKDMAELRSFSHWLRKWRHAKDRIRTVAGKGQALMAFRFSKDMPVSQRIQEVCHELKIDPAVFDLITCTTSSGMKAIFCFPCLYDGQEHDDIQSFSFKNSHIWERHSAAASHTDSVCATLGLKRGSLSREARLKIERVDLVRAHKAHVHPGIPEDRWPEAMKDTALYQQPQSPKPVDTASRAVSTRHTSISTPSMSSVYDPFSPSSLFSLHSLDPSPAPTANDFSLRRSTGSADIFAPAANNVPQRSQSPRPQDAHEELLAPSYDFSGSALDCSSLFGYPWAFVNSDPLPQSESELRGSITGQSSLHLMPLPYTGSDWNGALDSELLDSMQMHAAEAWFESMDFGNLNAIS
ncbi:hypothetical protein BC835DRAFT_1421938 [Cytidiella melzeri]|nr:hypothetical protein BC835DRAFT_1421938 [Cytidiella melzeri]